MEFKPKGTPFAIYDNTGTSYRKDYTVLAHYLSEGEEVIIPQENPNMVIKVGRNIIHWEPQEQTKITMATMPLPDASAATIDVSSRTNKKTLRETANQVLDSDAQKNIAAMCDELKAFLLTKNRNYGNSALAPLNVFSHISATDKLGTRLDDKLSRIRNAAIKGIIRKNDIIDLIGYLILLAINQGWLDLSDQID